MSTAIDEDRLSETFAALANSTRRAILARLAEGAATVNELAEPFEMVWIDRSLLDEAWKLYRRYRDHILSLCDCVSFAVMRRRRIQTAFAYDHDFEALGFSGLP